ncbi:MAG: DUF5722 domain-containing protein [Eubacteriales bacterium]
MTRSLPAILCLCVLCAAAAFFLSPLSVQADDILLAADAVLLSDAAETENVLCLDGFADGEEDAWMTGTNVASVTVREKGGSRYLVALPGAYASGQDYTVMRMYGEDAELNLMEYSALTFSILIPGASESEYTVRITLYSGLDTLSAEARVTGDEWYSVTAGIGDWALRTYINMFEITVTDEGGGVSSFAVGGVSACGRADTQIADAFLTFGLQAEGGSAEYRDGVYYLDAGADGLLTLAADAARPAYTAGDGVSVVRIVLDNALEGGYVSLAVSDVSASASSFTIASTCALSYGENTYLLPYDSDIALHAYRLSFRGLYPDGDAPVALRSVSLETFAGTDSGAYAGKITQCAFGDGMRTLTVSGTLPAAAAAENINGRLALYEIPVWRTPEEVLTEGEPLAVIKMSTKFTFSVDLSGRESTAAMSRYQAVILTDGSTTPIAPPRYPEQTAAASRSSLSVVGLYGADSAGVFESNASSVILDVYVDRLLAGSEGGGRLCVRGGRYYYLDYAYIRELDKEISFYVAADVEVYLRLLCASDLSDAGYTFSCAGAGFFAFNVRGEEGANMLCAVTEYLAARYSGLSGFICGERLDAAVYNGADMSDAAAYAALCADTMRLVYNCAVRYIPDVYVIAPIGHYEEEKQYAAALGEAGADAACDPALLSIMISRCLLREGDIPWGLMYVSDNAAEALSRAQNILVQMKAVGCRAPHEFLLFWQPSSGYSPDVLLAEYGERCLAAQNAGARVLFLSLASQTEQKDICAGLKYTLTGGDFPRQLSEFEAERFPDGSSYAGSFVLSDFSRAYSTLGWIAGSGCSRLGTQVSGLFGDARSLHAVFDSGTDAMFEAVSGNLLCVFSAADNLSYAPRVVYTLQVTSQLESTAEAELVFVFGSGDTRAEFSSTVPTGVPVDILCDLSEFAGAETIDFAAITVRSASSVTIDISSITCYSENLSTAQLASLYRDRASAPDATESTGEAWNAAQKMLIGAVLLASITMLALLSRRRGA